MLAIVLEVKKWHPYLLWRSFVVCINHHSLKYLWDQRIAIDSQQRWLAKLLRYDFVIEYKKGTGNSTADALSCWENSIELNAISEPVPRWLDSIKEEITTNPELQRLVKLCENDEAVGPWSFRDGVLFFKGRIYLAADSPLIPTIIGEFHCAAHEGKLKTMKCIKAVFYWVGLKRHVEDFVRSCDTCQHYKAQNLSLASLLQPLYIPNRVWSHISMVFVRSLTENLPFLW